MAQAVNAESQISAYPADELCPWCEQPISHQQFEQLRERLEEEKQQHAAEVAAEAKAQVDAAQKKAAAELKQAEQVAKQEADAARKEGKAAAEVELAEKLATADQKGAAAEKALAAERERHEMVLNERLMEQRDALEKNTMVVVEAEKAKAFVEHRKLEEKVEGLQRQLKKRTGEESGEGADLDLFEELKAEFPTDEIERVNPGEAGANILHRVFEKSRLCGVIVYDWNKRTSWRTSYVTNLRRDQLAAKADLAVLASGAFPAGSRHLDVRDGVIVASPARVIALTQILRNQLVQLSTLRLSNEAREEKVARLYDYITSDHFSHLLDQTETIIHTMLELEVKEKKAHDAMWKSRGKLLKSALRTQADLASGIDAIVAAPAAVLDELT